MPIERSITIRKHEPAKDGDPIMFELTNPTRLLSHVDNLVMMFNAMASYVSELATTGKVGKRPNPKNPDYGVVRSMTVVKVEPELVGGAPLYETRDVENLDYLPDALLMLFNGMSTELQKLAEMEAHAMQMIQARKQQNPGAIVGPRGQRMN